MKDVEQDAVATDETCKKMAVEGFWKGGRCSDK